MSETDRPKQRAVQSVSAADSGERHRNDKPMYSRDDRYHPRFARDNHQPRFASRDPRRYRPRDPRGAAQRPTLRADYQPSRHQSTKHHDPRATINRPFNPRGFNSHRGPRGVPYRGPSMKPIANETGSSSSPFIKEYSHRPIGRNSVNPHASSFSWSDPASSNHPTSRSEGYMIPPPIYTSANQNQHIPAYTCIQNQQSHYEERQYHFSEPTTDQQLLLNSFAPYFGKSGPVNVAEMPKSQERAFDEYTEENVPRGYYDPEMPVLEREVEMDRDERINTTEAVNLRERPAIINLGHQSHVTKPLGTTLRGPKISHIEANAGQNENVAHETYSKLPLTPRHGNHMEQNDGMEGVPMKMGERKDNVKYSGIVDLQNSPEWKPEGRSMHSVNVTNSVKNDATKKGSDHQAHITDTQPKKPPRIIPMTRTGNDPMVDPRLCSNKAKRNDAFDMTTVKSSVISLPEVKFCKNVQGDKHKEGSCNDRLSTNFVEEKPQVSYNMKNKDNTATCVKKVVSDSAVSTVMELKTLLLSRQAENSSKERYQSVRDCNSGTESSTCRFDNRIAAHDCKLNSSRNPLEKSRQEVPDPILMQPASRKQDSEALGEMQPTTRQQVPGLDVMQPALRQHQDSGLMQATWKQHPDASVMQRASKQQVPDSSVMHPASRQHPDSVIMHPASRQHPDSVLMQPASRQHQDSSKMQPASRQQVPGLGVRQPTSRQQVPDSSVMQPTSRQQVPDSSVMQATSRHYRDSGVMQPASRQQVPDSSVMQPTSRQVPGSSVMQPASRQQVPDSSVMQPTPRHHGGSGVMQPALRQQVPDSSVMHSTPRHHGGSGVMQPALRQHHPDLDVMQPAFRHQVPDSGVNQPTPRRVRALGLMQPPFDRNLHRNYTPLLPTPPLPPYTLMPKAVPHCNEEIQDPESMTSAFRTVSEYHFVNAEDKEEVHTYTQQTVRKRHSSILNHPTAQRTSLLSAQTQECGPVKDALIQVWQGRKALLDRWMSDSFSPDTSECKTDPVAADREIRKGDDCSVVRMTESGKCQNSGEEQFDKTVAIDSSEERSTSTENVIASQNSDVKSEPLVTDTNDGEEHRSTSVSQQRLESLLAKHTTTSLQGYHTGNIVKPLAPKNSKNVDVRSAANVLRGNDNESSLTEEVGDQPDIKPPRLIHYDNAGKATLDDRLVQQLKSQFAEKLKSVQNLKNESSSIGEMSDVKQESITAAWQISNDDTGMEESLKVDTDEYRMDKMNQIKDEEGENTSMPFKKRRLQERAFTDSLCSMETLFRFGNEETCNLPTATEIKAENTESEGGEHGMEMGYCPEMYEETASPVDPRIDNRRTSDPNFLPQIANVYSLKCKAECNVSEDNSLDLQKGHGKTLTESKARKKIEKQLKHTSLQVKQQLAKANKKREKELKHTSLQVERQLAKAKKKQEKEQKHTSLQVERQLAKSKKKHEKELKHTSLQVERLLAKSLRKTDGFKNYIEQDHAKEKKKKSKANICSETLIDPAENRRVD